MGGHLSDPKHAGRGSLPKKNAESRPDVQDDPTPADRKHRVVFPPPVAGEVVVYTSRNPQLVKPLSDDYCAR